MVVKSWLSLICVFLIAVSSPASASFNLDIDDDGKTDALTDGLLILRHMFGYSDEILVVGVVSGDANRTSPEVIQTYLISNEDKLDIDGSGSVDALTDGLLILRDLFGYSNSALVTGVISDSGTRTTSASIIDYISTIKDSDGDNIVDADDIYPLDALRTKHITWGTAEWGGTQWDVKPADIIWNETIWSN